MLAMVYGIKSQWNCTYSISNIQIYQENIGNSCNVNSDIMGSPLYQTLQNDIYDIYEYQLIFKKLGSSISLYR